MKKKSRFCSILGWTLLLALVAALSILPRLARDRAGNTSSEKLLSARVESGEITGTLSGGGTLKADKPVEITVPSGVEITDFLVSNGERVSAGDPIASVDPVTVMAAAVQAQEALDTLAGQLTDAANDKAAATLTAAAAGRVKAVFAHSGDDVRQVMLSYGCLAVISLDGKMNVEFTSREPLRPGEPVRVSVEGGKTYDGRVETVLEGTVSVTLTDNGPRLGDAVTVTNSDGTPVGTGTLTVHSPLRLMAESGTVNKVLVREDAKVNKGAGLLTLRDMEPSAEYESLAARRREYADVLRELFTLYRDGVVRAPGDGFVIDMDESRIKNVRAVEEVYRVVLLSDEESASVVPEGTTNELAVVTAVQNGGYLLASLGEVQIADYADLSAVAVDLNAMSVTPRLVSAPAYVWSGERGWQSYTNIQPGDVFLIARDSTGERLIFVRRINTQIPDIPVPELPSQSDIEAQLRERYNELIGSLPKGFSFPNFTMPSIPTQEEEELYSLEGTIIGSLVPAEGMKVAFPVDELDIRQYSVGMDAEITVDALPGRTFAGHVTEIGSIGVSNGGNSKYTVTVAFDRSGDMLDGMNASVSVRTHTATGLFIPTAALYDSGSTTYVYTALDLTGTAPAERREVTVGVSDGQRSQILSGLAEGESVWYVYYDSAGEEQGFGNVPESGTANAV